MKAIETTYSGIKYRSRTEARWAVFLDELRLPYAYEPEGFDLDGDWYLPDFWLPNPGVWLEVKGIAPNDRELRVAYALAKASRSPVVIAIGQPPVTDEFSCLAIQDGRKPIQVAFTGDGKQHLFISSECQSFMMKIRGHPGDYGSVPLPVEGPAKVAAAQRFGVHG